MSALTDTFTSIANAIRSKTGKSATLTPSQMIPEIDAVYEAGQAHGSKRNTSFGSVRANPITCLHNATWDLMTWNGLTSFEGYNVWSDKKNIYYSDGSTQYVLDIATSTWSVKTWHGYTEIVGLDVWTDGNVYYYSNGTTQYVLDSSTDTWTAKTWTGLTNFLGENVWTDGDSIYYSNESEQYELNVSTSSWAVKNWTDAPTGLNGRDLMSDGSHVIWAANNSSTFYKLAKSTGTWTSASWTISTYFGAYKLRNVWTDGCTIYISKNLNSRCAYYDAYSKEWVMFYWSSSYKVGDGERIWTDGYNLYYSYQTTQYVLKKSHAR